MFGYFFVSSKDQRKFQSGIKTFSVFIINDPYTYIGFIIAEIEYFHGIYFADP